MIWQKIMEIFLMIATAGFFIVLGKIIAIEKERAQRETEDGDVDN